jgi:hypothetical protein
MTEENVKAMVNPATKTKIKNLFFFITPPSFFVFVNNFKKQNELLLFLTLNRFSIISIHLLSFVRKKRNPLNLLLIPSLSSIEGEMKRWPLSLDRGPGGG